MKGLRENKTLEELRLCVNEIWVDEEEDEEVVENDLAVSIEKSSLKILALSRNALGDAGAIAIATGIQKNQSLISLIIPINSIHSDGCEAIGYALRYNATLQEIEIHGNTDNAAVCKSFRTSLQHMNYTMERVQLGTHTPRIGTRTP